MYKNSFCSTKNHVNIFLLTSFLYGHLFEKKYAFQHGQRSSCGKL